MRPALCEVCLARLAPEDLDGGATPPAACCGRVGLCRGCRAEAGHFCDPKPDGEMWTRGSGDSDGVTNPEGVVKLVPCLACVGFLAGITGVVSLYGGWQLAAGVLAAAAVAVLTGCAMDAGLDADAERGGL